ncbi:hypothetical protein RJ639_012658 [Escallonia herrerae]|uniref:RING-type E3 ubiquitin transferase n=1 Tax=Escallonia herrerae TaxID=1293975 RepID=A0AA88VLJ5_9ASTE|nr:hypothetical protein RJ639_012658 [Escallonia herrerae]
MSQHDSSDDGMNPTAVAIDKDKHSHYAVRWAIDNLLGNPPRIVLIHVRSRALHHRRPSAEASGEPNDADMQQLFSPYRGYCARKGIILKDVVLNDIDIPKALLDYVNENVISNFVLGASSRSRSVPHRKLSKNDVPSLVKESAPEFCSVYVISKGKVQSKRLAARRAANSATPPKLPPLRAVPHQYPADRSEAEDGARAQLLRRDQKGVTSEKIGPRKFPPIFVNGQYRSRNISARNLDFSIVADNSEDGNQSSGSKEVEAEMKRLKLELKQTMSMYNTACKEAVSATNKAKELNEWKMEEGRRLEQARVAEEAAIAMAEKEKAKCRAAVQYVLDPNLPPLPEITNNDSNETKAARKKREEDELVCRGHILNALSDRLYDLFTSSKCPKEIWKALENKYNNEKQGADKFLTLKYFEFTMNDSESVLDQVHQLQILVSKLKDLKAYRLLDLESNVIVESRDVEFIEDKFNSDSDFSAPTISLEIDSNVEQVRYRKYTIDEIETATEHFSESLKIGEGGYGPVYKGKIDHTRVAIKVLRPDAAQGRKQFQQEVEVLCCMRHPNMVLLLGACPEYGSLVYEFMNNGSLEDRLSRKGNTPSIPWRIRFKIAAEVATGLLFLHNAKPEPLVHRDLKPANILLDRNYNCKISDVGLSRLVPPSVADSVTQYHMTSAAGTFCHIDPEYQQTGKLGIKSDIYSLGVMLLQIITARPPMGLTHHIARAIGKGTFQYFLDPTVPDWPVEEALNFAKLALKCAELRRKDKPDLSSFIVPELNRIREHATISKSNHGTGHSHGQDSQNSSPKERPNASEVGKLLILHGSGYFEFSSTIFGFLEIGWSCYTLHMDEGTQGFLYAKLPIQSELSHKTFK